MLLLRTTSQRVHTGYDHLHCYRRLIRSDIPSSAQAGTTHGNAEISTCIIRCCQPTSRTGHHYSPLPCSSTPRGRSSGGKCRLTYSRTRVDGKPAESVGCRTSIEACPQTPSYSLYQSHNEKLTVCYYSLFLLSPLNGIPVSCPSTGTTYCGRCPRVRGSTRITRCPLALLAH